MSLVEVRRSTVGRSEDFVRKAVRHFSDYNSYEGGEFDPGEVIWIVHRGNRDVGFFRITIGEGVVSPEFWMHPHTCPKGLINVQRAATMHCMERVRRGDAESMMISVKDKYSVRVIGALCPMIEVTPVRNAYCCGCEKWDIPKDLYPMTETFEFGFKI